MKLLRLFLTVVIASLGCSLYAKKKAKPKAPAKLEKKPNPYVNIEIPSKICALIDKVDALVAKIEYYDNLALDGKKSADKKAKKLIADRKKLAEDVVKAIGYATKKENREADKLNKERDKLNKRFEALDDGEEAKIKALEAKIDKIELKLDGITDMTSKYKMFSEYAKGGKSTDNPYGLHMRMTPAFKGKTYDKEPQDFEFKGVQDEYVILVFFAVKHKQSFKMLSDMMGVTRSMKQAKIIGVCVDDDEEAAQKFVESKKPKFPIVADPYAIIRDKFFVSFLPQVVLIDPEGTVQGVYVGASSKVKTAVKDRIKNLIKEAKKK